MRTRIPAVVTALAGTFLLVLGSASPARAVTQAQKLSQAVTWTSISAASQSAWNGARVNRAPWAAFAFDWSTDYCSQSPDKPLGFDFKLSCHRHDFGYRNFKALNVFRAHNRAWTTRSTSTSSRCARGTPVPRSSRA
jgi:hypothetical protein